MVSRSADLGNPLGYRYGFNGKENDADVKGDGNQYDYGFRIYDPRLGRFLSVDALMNSYPYYSPYQFAGNMPIAAIDIDGLEQFVVIHYKDQKSNTYKTAINTVKSGSVLKDQEVYTMKAGKPIGEKIAKGNVLTFELYNEGGNNVIMRIEKNGDRTDNKLSPQEDITYQSKNKKFDSKKESGNDTYSYPSKDDEQFGSATFDDPVFYEALAYSPINIKGYASFNGDGFKDGSSWIHAYKEKNGSTVFSNQLDERLRNIKSDDNVKAVNITINVYTEIPFNAEQMAQNLENVKKEYKKHASQVSGVKMDKINVTGTYQRGDSNKSSVTISAN